jgi:hypothetical protein
MPVRRLLKTREMKCALNKTSTKLMIMSVVPKMLLLTNIIRKLMKLTMNQLEMLTLMILSTV